MTAGTQVQDRTVKLNGLTFHYRDWGNTGAQALVLLHGFSSHARTWDRLAGAMCERYHVLALDQRGHGETEWAAEYGRARMVEDVEEFVRELDLKHFALLGLSMGGSNAYAYAGSHPGPETVERLVIVDIGPRAGAAGISRILASVQAQDVFDDPEDAVRLARAGNALAPDDELRHRVLNNLKQTDDGRWTYRYDRALRSPDRQVEQRDTEADFALLRAITAPTLLLRGEHSDVLPAETAERMVREMKDCRLITVPAAGHSIPLDNPSGFVQAVQTFL